MLIGIDANEANLTQKRVGINQYAFDLLHALYANPQNHQFVIYLKNPPLSDLPQSRYGWDYRVIPFPKFWTQTRLPFDLFTHKPRPDVFFSMTHYAPRWCPIPSVVAIMDIGFLRNPEQFTTKDFTQLKNWTKYSIMKAKKIITISNYTKEDIANTYHKTSQEIIVTYPSYDESLFKPTKNLTVLKKYKIKDPYILFLSSLKPSKNVEGLIRAFKIVSEKNKQLTLVISGKKAWQYERIFSLTQELNLEKRVIFTGFVNENEVPVLMSMSKAFILPSFFEGFGIPVLEAMACHVPVVISQVASLPEVAGEAGIYIDPKDPTSIARGIDIAISEKSKKFVSEGINRVKLFSWKKTAQQTLICLETAMEKN